MWIVFCTALDTSNNNYYANLIIGAISLVYYWFFAILSLDFTLLLVSDAFCISTKNLVIVASSSGVGLMVTLVTALTIAALCCRCIMHRTKSTPACRDTAALNFQIQPANSKARGQRSTSTATMVWIEKTMYMQTDVTEWHHLTVCVYVMFIYV